MHIFPADYKRVQTPREELANSLSHGLGLIAACVGSSFLITHAVREADVEFVVGTSIFSATMIILYLTSTLYHGLPHGKAKRMFWVIEHSAIFLLIAGTYTPFTFGLLRGPWGWSLFGIIWGLAAIGVFLKAFGKASHPVVSTGLYLCMGWIIVVAADPLLDRMPQMGLLLLVAGGLSYTIGVLFFSTDARLLYGHFIWHLFVLAGTACHYAAVLLYAYP